MSTKNHENLLMMGLDLTGLGKSVMGNISAFSWPAEVDLLISAPSEAKSMVGWTPNTMLAQLGEMTMLTDLRRNQVCFTF